MAARTSKHTTALGYRNGNGQVVVSETGLPGTDHGQHVYVLQCAECGHIYGANGSDIFQRKCPVHQDGAPGLPLDLCDIDAVPADLATVCYKPGQVYRDTAASKKKSGDEFLHWFDTEGHSIPNSGGVRWRDFINIEVIDPLTHRKVPAYFVLVTVRTKSQYEKPWTDRVGVNQIVYHGDAKHHRQKRKYNDFHGNQRLEAADNIRRQGIAAVPPVLHFTKFATGWVQFNGLCILEGVTHEALQDRGHSVENLIAQLTVLNADVVPLRWLRERALAIGTSELDRLAPAAWRAALNGNIVPNSCPRSAPAAALASRRIALTAPNLPKSEFDFADDEDAREKVAAQICRRRGQLQFRRQLLYIYERRCTISGCAVVELLEACHIKPYMGPRTNHPCNGILLRADLHTLFDLGLISIDTKTMSVIVSPVLDSSEYATFRGRELMQPVRPELRPSVKALDEHRSRNFPGETEVKSVAAV